MAEPSPTVISFRTCAEARVQIGFSCRNCQNFRSYSIESFVSGNDADRDLVEARNGGHIRCGRCNDVGKLMTFIWRSQLGGRNFNIARWTLGEPVSAFELPDADKGPSNDSKRRQAAAEAPEAREAHEAGAHNHA
jgi:hypothetical protein